MKKAHKIKPVESVTDFAESEVGLLDHWYKNGIVEKYLTKNKNSKNRFSFLDGPITANNPMGVHHGWGRTYKDLWQRYYTMKGYKQRYQNGFDAQGLWVEVEVEKELGFKSKKDIEAYGVAEFVQKCKDRVLKYSQIQTEQSKRLGYFMDWDHSYFTMSDENNYMIWHFLKVCHQNGWLYKGHGSVPWCPRCETAISQHEMLTEDYQEVIHKAIYLELPLVGREREFLLIWTTTPWTIPANIAVAVDPTLEYVAIKGTTGDLFWLAKNAVERVFKSSTASIVKEAKGQELVGLKYLGPFDDLPAVQKVANHPLFHTIIAADPQILSITTTEGTGLVHTAVSAGSEDFKLGQKLGLPMIPVIDDNADYSSDLGFLAGKNAKTHPEVILDFLIEEDKKGNNWIFEIEDYKHRYPTCWRCKTELVWKVTDEWYIAMDKAMEKGAPTLRERMKMVTKQINWIPSFGLDRELDWLNNMHDWLISKKNRYWGLCLPIWECKKCGHFEVIGGYEELKEKAAEGWKKFEGHTPHKPHLDYVKIKCTKCGALTQRIEPVGNPWLDAGIVPFSTIAQNNQGQPLYHKDKKDWQDWFPADFITESFPGQFKNWFYSLIAMSTALENTQPFKTVLGFATLFGEDGRPMHKSWGNAIEFNEGADKIGVDVMRWLFVRQNPAANLLFGYKTAAEIKRQFHLILWNSYRFFANYAAYENWTPLAVGGAKTLTKALNYTPLDLWVLSRLSHTQQAVEVSLDKYDAFHAVQAIESFVNDFSTWYIRRSRDRVGPSAASNDDKNTCYSILHNVLVTLSQTLMPFMPFISERMYTNLTGELSVHLANWPELDPSVQNETLETQMSIIREIVELGHAQRKTAEIKLRQPLEKVTVSGYGNVDLASLEYLVKDELNVKNVVWLKAENSEQQLRVLLDVTVTPELKTEGSARELVRQLQDLRKAQELNVSDKIEATYEQTEQNKQAVKMFENYIKSKVQAVKLTPSGKTEITKM